MKRILILCSAYNDEFFGKKIEVIEKTWAKDIIDGKYANIEFYSYSALTEDQMEITPHTELGAIDSTCNSVLVPTKDDVKHSYDKFMSVIKTLMYKIKDCDYVLHVNSNVYVNVPLMNKFINDIEDDDMNVYCGQIMSCKYTSAPFNYCFYGRTNSLLLKKEYIEVLIDKECKYNAFTKDSVQSSEELTEYRHGVDENAIGLILNTKFITDELDHTKYYQDWNMKHINEVQSDEWYKELTLMICDSDGFKELENLYNVYNKVKDDTHSYGIEFNDLYDYINSDNTPTITQILDEESKDVVITKYSLDDYRKWLWKNKFNMKFLDETYKDVEDVDPTKPIWRKIGQYWWLDDSCGLTFEKYYNLPERFFDFGWCWCHLGRFENYACIHINGQIYAIKDLKINSDGTLIIDK